MSSLSDKQLFSLHDSDARINIWEGAVRSGKTYVSLWRWIKELSFGPRGEYCIITRTYDSFKRNLLPQLTNMIGSDVKYYSGKREMVIFNKTIHIVGADDERSEAKIRGPTFSGAYVDEATIIPESVFRMLISRCAMKGAKIFVTTNPDSPYHWLKKDFLTDNPDVKSWKFTLDDNPELTEDERDYLKRQYKGIWFQRFIEGRWVQAEGAIYDFFDTSLHTIDFPPGQAEFYIVGVDYGTTNPCSFVLIGINRSKYPNIWVEDVYYWNSKIKQRQKTDSEYADDLKKFIEGRVIKAIYIDPSAASFKLELNKCGVQNLYDAENEVLDGIRMVSKFLSNGTMKICRKCEPLIREIQGYVWDAKSAKTGIDKPSKEMDHACVVGSTLVLTEKGYRRIDQLPQLGKIYNFNTSLKIFEEDYFTSMSMTRENAEIYELELDDGSTLSATGDHLILTSDGYKMLQNLNSSDKVAKWNTNSSMNINFT
jgi:PBSX family phage terminase large subunit